MADYNLYEHLGLDPQAPTFVLRDQLDRLIADTPEQDNARLDELKTARAIFDNQDRRNVYDGRLADPDAEEVGIQPLRDIAGLQVGGSNASSAPEKKSQNWVSLLLAALAGALIFALFAGALFAVRHVTSDGHKAQAIIKEMLSKDTEEKLRDWALKSTDPRTRDEAMRSLKLDDDRTFNGLDALFKANDLKVGDAYAMIPMVAAMSNYDDGLYDDFLDEGFSRDEVDTLQSVIIQDGSGRTVGNALVIISGGKAKVVEIDVISPSKSSSTSQS